MDIGTNGRFSSVNHHEEVHGIMRRSIVLTSLVDLQERDDHTNIYNHDCKHRPLLGWGMKVV